MPILKGRYFERWFKGDLQRVFPSNSRCLLNCFLRSVFPVHLRPVFLKRFVLQITVTNAVFIVNQNMYICTCCMYLHIIHTCISRHIHTANKSLTTQYLTLLPVMNSRFFYSISLHGPYFEEPLCRALFAGWLPGLHWK